MVHMFSYFLPCRWREHFDSIVLLAKHLKDWNCIHTAFVFASNHSNHKHVANWEQCWVKHPTGVMNLNGRLMQILAIKLLKTIICDLNSFIIKQVIQPPDIKHSSRPLMLFLVPNLPRAPQRQPRLFSMLVLAVTVGDPTGNASGIGPGCHPTYWYGMGFWMGLNFGLICPSILSGLESSMRSRWISCQTLAVQTGST